MSQQEVLDQKPIRSTLTFEPRLFMMNQPLEHIHMMLDSKKIYTIKPIRHMRIPWILHMHETFTSQQTFVALVITMQQHHHHQLCIFNEEKRFRN